MQEHEINDAVGVELGAAVTADGHEGDGQGGVGGAGAVAGVGAVPEMADEAVEDGGAGLADFAAVRAGAVEELEAGGFDREKFLIARQFFGRGGSGGEDQPRIGRRMDFFEQRLHGRTVMIPGRGRQRNLVGDPVFKIALARMPEAPDPDAALMLRVQRGERAAFAELVDKYRQPLANFIFRTVRDETEAEDLAQNVFLQVYKSRDRYKRTAKFSTWLFTIARNLCLNELRRRSRHPAESLSETGIETDDQPGRQYEDKNALRPAEEALHGELAAKIEQALAALPENQRTAILLCRQEELSYEEIAAVLGCSLSATKSLIHRGRETLKERLKPYLQTGEWH